MEVTADSDKKVSYTVRMKAFDEAVWFEFSVTHQVVEGKVTPQITFKSKLFHPYIDDESGESKLLTA